MALFCEDIREEKGGTYTLVGILSDSINVNALDAQQFDSTESKERPKILGRLCLYIRINFDPEDDLEKVVMKIDIPGGGETNLGEVESEVIEKSKTQAKTKGNLLAGLISKISLDGFQLPSPGFLKATVEIDGKKYLAGAINVKHVSPNEGEATSSSAS